MALLFEKGDVEGYFKLNGNNYPTAVFELEYNTDITNEEELNFSIRWCGGSYLVNSRNISEVTGITTVREFLVLLKQLNVLSSNDVVLQDSTADEVIANLVSEIANTTLAADMVVNTYTMQVTSATGFVVGRKVRVIDSINDRYYQGSIVLVSGTTITLDNNIDFAYAATSQVIVVTDNLNVNGATTPVPYYFRVGNPSVPSGFHLTRMIMTCVTSSATDLTKFGDLTRLTRGLLFRIEKETYTKNMFSLKDGAEASNISFDYDPYDQTIPGQGVYGFRWRLTFNGQEKLGIVKEILQNENFVAMVQDNLTGLLSLKVKLEGHRIVE